MDKATRAFLKTYTWNIGLNDRAIKEGDMTYRMDLEFDMQYQHFLEATWDMDG